MSASPASRAVRVLATTALLFTASACRFFDDDVAPCRDDRDCTLDEVCGTSGTCVPVDAGADVRDDAGRDAGVPDSGVFDPCKSDVFGADLFSVANFGVGDCLPDLIVSAAGLPGAGEGTPATRFVATFVADGSGSLVEGPQFEPRELAGAPARLLPGFGAALAINPIRRDTAGRTFLIGDTRDANNAGRVLLVTPSQQGSNVAPFEGTSGGGDAVAFGDAADSRFLMGVPRASGAAGRNGGILAIVPTTPVKQASLLGIFRAGAGAIGEVVRRIGNVDDEPGAELGVSAIGLRDSAAAGEEYGVIGVSLAHIEEIALPVKKRWRTKRIGERFGSAFADMGDLNDDGVPDILIGAPAALGGGAVEVLFDEADNRARTEAPIGLSQAAFGATIEPLGDVDGDGLVDVLVAAPFASSTPTSNPACASLPGVPADYAGNCAGTVFVFTGAALRSEDAAPACAIASTTGGERFGTALRALSRVAPTVVRVAVGAPGTAISAGRVYLTQITMFVRDGAPTTCAATTPTVLVHATGGAGDQFGATFGQ